jgi:hypothetical protein
MKKRLFLLPIIVVGLLVLWSMAARGGAQTSFTATPTSTPAARVYLPLILRIPAPHVAQVVFEFSEVVQPEGDTRELAVAFHSIDFIDAHAEAISTLTFGTPEANALQGEGWFENETDPQLGPFQWAGGPAKRATMQLAVPQGAEGLLLDITGIQDGIWMTVTVGADPPATLRVDAFQYPSYRFWREGYVPLGEPLQIPATGRQPQWTEGRAFPHFPSTDRVYNILTHHKLYHYAWSTAPDCRINGSFDTMNSLTLVGMQGLINRDTPQVYLRWLPAAGGFAYYKWADELRRQVNVVDLELDGLSAINFLYRKYASRFQGAVIYDPEVPDTINLATMIAGLEDRMILAPDQLGLPGIPQFDDVVDLRPLAQAEGWDATEEGKTRLYQWAYDHLWRRLEHRIIGVISPGPPTSRTVPDGTSYNVLGLAARDYMVALRLPALWLSPLDEPQAGLFDQFLAEAPSPIPVLGFFGNDEFGTVALASRHGDWVPVITNAHAGGVTCGNLTLLGGVRPELTPYQAEVDNDRLFATLGDKPVMTIVTSDGDSLQLQMERGTYGTSNFVWEEVQGHRFGWSTNPTLAELAPVVWNYYTETRDQVSLLAFFSGAGYTYPLMMDGAQLRGYLDHTARYLEDTGLRAVSVCMNISDTEAGPWEDVAVQYYDVLSGTGYLGAFLVGGQERGLHFDYAGAPSPAVDLSYIYNSTGSEAIIADLLARKPGEEFTDVTLGHIAPDCWMVADADASGGWAALVPPEFSQSPSCCLAVASGTMKLLPGEYTVTFRMKVTNNQHTEPFAAIYVGETPTDWHQIAYQSIAPSDFEQAKQYQDFTLSFTLERFTPEVEFRIDYWRGATALYVDTIRATRSGGSALPIFGGVFIVTIDQSQRMTEAPQLAEDFEAAGGITLHPDEFLAALNPEFMIEWATPILGADHPALAQAQAQLQNGDFFDSLLTVREALRTLPEHTYLLEGEDVAARANTWITDLAFDQSARQISFRTHGPPEGTVQASVEISKGLLVGPFLVNVDEQSHAFTTSENGDYTTLDIEFAQGPHQVVVIEE